MSMFSSARAKRALLSLCVFFPMLAFGASSNHDARVVWLTLPGSVLKVSPVDGSAALQLAGLNRPGALAVEGDNDTVWVYGQKAITGYDHLGNTLITVSLPPKFHGGSPSGMAVDNAAGNIWIAIQKDLYRLNMGGELQADITLASNATAASLDLNQSHLWVAEQASIEVFDASGNRVLNIAQSNANPPTAIAYDVGLKQTWALYSSSIARYDASGNQIISAVLASDLGSFIAPDGQGGAWVGGQQNLARLDTTGTAQFVIQPFAGLSGGNALGLVADAVDHSAWVANSLHLRHYDTSGSFLLEAALPVGPGNGNGMQQLGYFVDTTPPTVSITAPTSGLWTNKNQLPITLAYSDDTGVDPSSVQVTANGNPLVVTCQANSDDSGAICTPNSPLPDGGYSLSVTVADYAGNVSKPATVSFNVLTVPPTITVTNPSSPYTNQPNVTVTGSVNQPGTLTINGVTVPMAADGSFSDAVTLIQGDNTLTFFATDLAGNTASVSRTINLNTMPPVPVVNGDISVTGPTNGQVTVTGKAGSAAPNVSVTITDTKTGVSVTVTSDATGAFTATLAAGSNDSLQISEQDKWGNVTTDPNPIAISNLPPDPASVAPPLSTTAYTSFADQTSFLYSGASPIQTGVASGTIVPQRASVIRGKVLDVGGNPLPGATITILNHPEYGQTLSRADGMFDMAVNGGGPLMVNYAMKGYLTAQRQVQVPWKDFAYVNMDVALVKFDPQVTPVTFGNANGQLVAGSTQTDMNGSRQAAVYFPAGTTATMILADGSTQPLTNASFRATEFTVGAYAQQSMPAELQPGVSYTYAVNLSFDESRAAGARQVTFSQPVPVYVDDFLKFPVGAQLPDYVYDDVQAKWILQSNSALVMQVLGHDSQGNAILDVDGTGVAATAAELAQLGISSVELAVIGGRYSDGSRFWRWLVKHFSDHDTNPNKKGKTGAKANSAQAKPTDNHDCLPGCVINPQGQSLGENVPVTGTPFVLHYSSDRQNGYTDGRRAQIQITGNTVPPGLQSVVVWFRVAGQEQQYIISHPAPNQIVTYLWNGKDAYGRQLVGQVPAGIRVGYVFDPVEYALNGSVEVTIPTNLVETDPWNDFGVVVQGLPVPPHANQAGWSLNVHHAFDPETGSIYLGDGSVRHGTNYPTVALLTSGGGVCCSVAQTGQPVLYHGGMSISDVAVAPDGETYFAGSTSTQAGIFRVDQQGLLQLVQATPTPAGYSPSSYAPTRLAFAPDGSIYYAVEQTSPTYYETIFRRFPDGTVSKVIGNPTCSSGSFGVPATQACLLSINGLAVGPDGTLYIAEGSQWIVSVGTDGVYRLVQLAGYNSVWDVAVGPDGSVYFGGGVAYRIFRKTPDGTLSVVVGNGYQGHAGVGGLATQAQLYFPTGMKVAADGTLYIMDGYVKRVTPDGILTFIAGGGQNDPTPQGVPAINTNLANAQRLALSPDGAVVVAGNYGGKMFSIRPDISGAGQQAISFLPKGGGYQAASDDGTELYLFDPAGRQIETLDAVTKAVIYSFGYDANGNLTSVTDVNGRVTTIQVDGNGNPTAIVSPDGQITALTVDTHGYLASVADPAGDTYRMTSTRDGLLLTFKDPNGKLDSYGYDGYGRFTNNTNAVGGGWTLDRTETLSNYTITAKSASGLTRTFTVQNPYDGMQQTVDTEADGTTHSTVLDTANNNTTETAADGIVTTTQFTGDPRFGASVKIPQSLNIKTPSGLSYSLSDTRTAPLSNPGDLFSFTSLTDSVSINGQSYISTFAPGTKTWTSTTPTGRKSTTTVDSLDRPVATQLGSLTPVTYAYDSVGHLQSFTAGSGAAARTTQYSYYATGPSQGRLQSVTDPLNRSVGYQYDAAGRVAVQTLPDGQQIQFGYDAKGNLTSLTPPGRPAHAFDYDGIDETQDYTPPAISGVTDPATHYVYNLDRKLTQITRPDGQQVGLGYDTGGRLSTVSIPTGTYQYSYVPVKGQLQGVTSPSGEGLAYAWDGSLNTGTTWSGSVAGSVTRTFDNNFRVTSLGVNGSAVAYGYDNDGLLTSAGSETLQRDAADGLITSTTLGTIATAETYDNFGAPQTDAANAGSTALYDVTYTRDNVGRITGKTETVHGVNHSYGYGYDPRGRLNSVTTDGNQVTYGYDANGNRTQVNGATVATYDDQDRLLAYGSNSYGYTANGELLTKTDSAGTTNYTYDVLGNLTDVTLANGTKVHYLVDGQNRRVGKQVNGSTVQEFLYQNQLSPVAELDSSSNVVQRYVYGSRANVPDYIIEGPNTYRVITDQLGSPRLIVDASSGATVEQIDYDSFGNVVNDTNPGFQPFRYAGGLYDQDTKLVHFGARDYDPYAGRWTLKDPIRFKGLDPDLYTYTFNDPINFIDPQGLWGFGLTGSASIEAGVGLAGVGATAAAGAGVFGGGSEGLNLGAFASGGAFAGGPGFDGPGWGPSAPASDPDKANFATGAFVGLGGGLFFTNAHCAQELKGPFDTYSFNIGFGPIQFSVQFGISGDTWIGSFTVGPGIGGNVSGYQTNTVTTR